MIKVDVIVINYDLVLVDLVLGGGVILFDLCEIFYVFDEGYYLLDKVIGYFVYFICLCVIVDWLEQIVKNFIKLFVQYLLLGDFGCLIEQVLELVWEIKIQQQFMFIVCEEIGDFCVGEDMEGCEWLCYCFVGGVVFEYICEMGIELKKGFFKLIDLFICFIDIFKEVMDGEGVGGIVSYQVEEWYLLFGSFLVCVQGNWELWIVFICEDLQDSLLMVCWLIFVESGSFYDIEVNVSLIFVVEILCCNLWNVVYGVLVILVILIVLGIFDCYCMCVGLLCNVVIVVVLSFFYYVEVGVLWVFDFKVDLCNVVEYIVVIICELLELVKGVCGSLVLFFLCKQMQEVFDGFDCDWCKWVFIQGNLFKQEILNKYKL